MRSTFARKIGDKELQWTPQRKMILSILTDNPDKHLTAQEVYLKTQRKMPKVGLATVYRTLALFYEEGIIERYDLPGQAAEYELIPKDACPHYHCKCLKCGKILDIPIDGGTILSILEDKALVDFLVEKVSWWYFGYCQGCIKD